MLKWMEQRHHFRSPYEADAALLHGTVASCYREDHKRHLDLYNSCLLKCYLRLLVFDNNSTKHIYRQKP